MFIPSLLVVVL